jgi:hypothetical protein
MRDFDAGGKAVEDEPAGLVFKNRDQIRKLAQILLCAVNRGGQAAIERAGNGENLLPAGVCTSRVVDPKDLRVQLGFEK